MAFLFTLIYIVIAFMTPELLFGSWVGYHIEVIIAGLAVLLSIPNLLKGNVFKAPQSLAFAGMSFAVLVYFVQTGWFGGAFSAFYDYLRPVLAFYLVAANCKSKTHLRLIVLALFLGSVFYITAGLIDLRNGTSPSPYLYGDLDLRRLRGLGEVNDPNDFSQFMVALIPAMFLWRLKSKIGSVFVVGIPVIILLVGMYFTHSRGAALALVAVVLVSARRKIGTIPAGVLAGILFLVTLAIGWSGGRSTSMEGGADRLELWSEGLNLIKSHPLFGVGLGNFAEEVGITAHNSVVVCAAEIGLVGFYFWILLLFSTVRSGVRFARTEEPARVEDDGVPASMWLRSPTSGLTAKSGETAKARGSNLVNRFAATDIQEPIDQRELHSMVTIIIIALTGFLTAGWFLSRAISMWLFMYCGMIYAILQMAINNQLTVKKDRLSYLFSRTLWISVGLLLLVYVMLRARAL